MWQSIKRFFKWTADHTGISWIARKISSGWNDVKNWWSGSKVSNTNSPKTPKNPSEIPVDEPSLTNEPGLKKPEPEPVIGGIYEDKKNKLELFVESNNISKILGGGLGIDNNVSLNPTGIADKLKYRAYVKCEEGRIFQVTCGKLIEANNNGAFLSIESLASQDGNDLSSELEGMKNMLGLSNNHAVVIITQISKGPIMELMPEVVTNGNTPNSGITGPGAQPHAANGCGI
ncbi:MAG: hypothetical protein PG978_000981 [Wolbachia endosymbiont of Ctenocephalides felis wCfeF]|nr:MAG: hypothetical protein PG978_000981 [Wolbachia endosymbiont of Ctenocephalides felis wCfeF]